MVVDGWRHWGELDHLLFILSPLVALDRLSAADVSQACTSDSGRQFSTSGSWHWRDGYSVWRPSVYLGKLGVQIACPRWRSVLCWSVYVLAHQLLCTVECIYSRTNYTHKFCALQQWRETLMCRTDDNRKDYQNCSVLYCVLQLYTEHICEQFLQLTVSVKDIGLSKYTP